MSNPYMFNEMYPDKDLENFNSDEAYEMGVDTGIHLSDDQKKAVITLIDREMKENMDNDDGAYNPYWDFIKEKLGVKPNDPA